MTGTEKYFDIYACTVDEVDSYETASGKKMIKVVVGLETYTGLHNQWVYDYLCANEGSPSFIVLWKAPRGAPMLAYAKTLWTDHIEGKDNEAVSSLSHAEAYKPTGESFVYLWINKDTDTKYIGKHKGSPDDGYICSSEGMLAEYSECPQRFIRTVLAYGTDQEMLELETMLLLQLKTTMSPMFFNLSNNLRRD
jgi:hypothetical protein